MQFKCRMFTFLWDISIILSNNIGIDQIVFKSFHAACPADCWASTRVGRHGAISWFCSKFFHVLIRKQFPCRFTRIVYNINSYFPQIHSNSLHLHCTTPKNLVEPKIVAWRLQSMTQCLRKLLMSANWWLLGRMKLYLLILTLIINILEGAEASSGSPRCGTPSSSNGDQCQGQCDKCSGPQPLRPYFRSALARSVYSRMLQDRDFESFNRRQVSFSHLRFPFRSCTWLCQTMWAACWPTARRQRVLNERNEHKKEENNAECALPTFSAVFRLFCGRRLVFNHFSFLSYNNYKTPFSHYHLVFTAAVVAAAAAASSLRTKIGNCLGRLLEAPSSAGSASVSVRFRPISGAFATTWDVQTKNRCSFVECHPICNNWFALNDLKRCRSIVFRNWIQVGRVSLVNSSKLLVENVVPCPVTIITRFWQTEMSPNDGTSLDGSTNRIRFPGIF